MKIRADFTKITGSIKPMHAVGSPPVYSGTAGASMSWLTRAGMPYGRLHDVGSRFGAGVYVDIPNIFRDFNADESDPASYDFPSTDVLLSQMHDANCEPFYRLGVTIENDSKLVSYRIFPPKDPEKWARICEHIIRHYNEGWANGYHFGITYWEIWNEPDDCINENPMMWRGTKEEYFRLYEVTARHLKECFGDTIKVGGFSTIGFYGYEHDPDGTGVPYPVVEKDENGRDRLLPGVSNHDFFLLFNHEFLNYISSPEHKASLDFFSWHSYADVPTTLKMQEYCRKMLAYHGFDHVVDFLTEWNLCHDTTRCSPKVASMSLSMMLAMQKTRTSMCCYYDASMCLHAYSGLFNAETLKPNMNYFAFMMFNQLYRLHDEIDTFCSSDDVYVGGAVKGDKKILLIANTRPIGICIDLELIGADVNDMEVLVIDETYSYSPTGITLENGQLRLRGNCCAELRF